MNGAMDTFKQATSPQDMSSMPRSREDGFLPVDPDGGVTGTDPAAVATTATKIPDAAAAAADAWKQEVDTSEMIDDPVRMYLREIGRVSLLKAPEERTLAREMEAGKHFDLLDQGMGITAADSVRYWQYVLQLLKRIGDAQPLENALVAYLGIEDGPRSIRELMSSPEMRDALGWRAARGHARLHSRGHRQGPRRGEARPASLLPRHAAPARRGTARAGGRAFGAGRESVVRWTTRSPGTTAPASGTAPSRR